MNRYDEKVKNGVFFFNACVFGVGYQSVGRQSSSVGARLCGRSVCGDDGFFFLSLRWNMRLPPAIFFMAFGTMAFECLLRSR